MEKILLKSKEDLKSAISHFGKEYKAEIKELVSEYPCILIGCYPEDLEYGFHYTFTTITEKDFDKKSGECF